MEYVFRHADGRRLGRAGRDLLPSRRDGDDLRGPQPLHLQRSGPQARWHDGTPITAEDVAFSYMTLKQQGQPGTVAAARRAGRSDCRGRAHGNAGLRRHAVGAGDPDDRHRLPHSFEGMVRDARLRPRRRWNRRPARGRTGSAAFNARARYIEYERVDGLLGRGISARRAGWTMFQTIRIEFYQERQAGLRGLQEGRHHLARGVHLEELGNGVRIPGRSSKARSLKETVSRARSGHRCRRWRQTSAAQTVPRTGNVRDADRAVLRFRMDERANLFYGDLRQEPLDLFERLATISRPTGHARRRRDLH